MTTPPSDSTLTDKLVAVLHRIAGRLHFFEEAEILDLRKDIDALKPELTADATQLETDGLASLGNPAGIPTAPSTGSTGDTGATGA